jgi:selenide,water dikinase
VIRLVLLGSGHAHLFVLEALARRGPRGLDITLVSLDARPIYSGMVPGLIGGRYALPDLSFDLTAMCRGAGARFLEGEVTRIEPTCRRIVLADGTAHGYDLLSVATGSTVEGADLPGVARHALRVKPIGQAKAVVSALDRLAGKREPASVIVVGGGAAGVELALAARSRLRILGKPRASVILVEAGTELLGGGLRAAERLARRALAANGIGLRLGRRALSVGKDAVELASGESLPADAVVWATGAAAPLLLRQSGLPLDARGFLLVNDRLQSTGDPAVFATGDAATLEPHPGTPKAGVYAVREGPVLARNLLSAAGGTSALASYRPQPRFLALLNTGEGRAIVSYGRFATWASWGMRLKDRIDRGFMRRFQKLEHTVDPA